MHLLSLLSGSSTDPILTGSGGMGQISANCGNTLSLSSSTTAAAIAAAAISSKKESVSKSKRTAVGCPFLFLRRLCVYIDWLVLGMPGVGKQPHQSSSRHTTGEIRGKWCERQSRAHRQQPICVVGTLHDDELFSC